MSATFYVGLFLFCGWMTVVVLIVVAIWKGYL